MRNGFAPVPAIIDDDAEAVFEVKFTGKAGGGKEEVPKDGLVFLGSFADTGDGYARNDKQMGRRLGVDVP